jgi:hypothetical protein
MRVCATPDASEQREFDQLLSRQMPGRVDAPKRLYTQLNPTNRKRSADEWSEEQVRCSDSATQG